MCGDLSIISSRVAPTPIMHIKDKQNDLRTLGRVLSTHKPPHTHTHTP